MNCLYVPLGPMHCTPTVSFYSQYCHILLALCLAFSQFLFWITENKRNIYFPQGQLMSYVEKVTPGLWFHDYCFCTLPPGGTACTPLRHVCTITFLLNYLKTSLVVFFFFFQILADCGRTNNSIKRLLVPPYIMGVFGEYETNS